MMLALDNWAFSLGATAFVSYLWLVRRLRWRYYDAIHAKFDSKFKAGKLTPRDAQEILQVSSFYDMPMLLTYSLAFALFKTYAVPSISKLLASTKEFTCPHKVSKRYIDTELLICSWLAFPIPGKFGDDKDEDLSDPRGTLALARTNWLHSKYRITNDDYLFTLSLFVLEPYRWAQRYGWRPLSPMEVQAFFIVWQEIGKRMNISDVPETLDAMIQWSDDYAARTMVPAETNHEVSMGTTNELLHAVPEAFGIKNFCRRITVCLVDDRVREAMLLDTQPWYLHVIAKCALVSVKLFHKHLCLPRIRREMITAPDIPTATPGSLPRLHPTRFAARPWYRPQRTGLASLLDRFLVLVGFHEDMPGPKYRSSGYRIEELGPLKFEQEGHDEVMKLAEKLQGCPIKGSLSLNP